MLFCFHHFIHLLVNLGSPEDNSEFEEKMIVRSNSVNESYSSQKPNKEISKKPEKPAHFKSLDNVSNISDSKSMYHFRIGTPGSIYAQYLLNNHLTLNTNLILLI